MEALVTKQGGRIKTWKQRWCVLNDENLYYYKPPKSLTIRDNSRYANRQGSIKITEIKEVGPATDEKKRHTFKVVTPERTYVIAANDEDQKKKWIKAIQTVIEKRAQKKTTSSRDSQGKPSPSIKKATVSESDMSVPIRKEYLEKTQKEIEILLENIDSKRDFEIENVINECEKQQLEILNELMAREISAVKEKYIPEQEEIRKDWCSKRT